MRLSTKGRYAVTAMIDLAIHDQTKPVALAEISECQNISLSYLEQLFAKLRQAGLVKGMRGPGGGYRLAQEAANITIANIILAVDEKVDITRCGGKEDCFHGERCLTHALWSELSNQIVGFLEGITLAQLISNPAVQEVAQRQNTTHNHLEFSKQRSVA